MPTCDDSLSRDQPCGHHAQTRLRSLQWAVKRVLRVVPRSSPRLPALFSCPFVLAPSFSAPAARRAGPGQICAAGGLPPPEIPIASVRDDGCAKSNGVLANGCLGKWSAHRRCIDRSAARETGRWHGRMHPACRTWLDGWGHQQIFAGRAMVSLVPQGSAGGLQALRLSR